MSDENHLLPDGSRPADWAPTGYKPPLRQAPVLTSIVCGVLAALFWLLCVGMWNDGIHGDLALRHRAATAVTSARVTRFYGGKGYHVDYTFDVPAPGSSVRGYGDVNQGDAFALASGRTDHIAVIYRRDNPAINEPVSYMGLLSDLTLLAWGVVCFMAASMTWLTIKQVRLALASRAA